MDGYNIAYMELKNAGLRINSVHKPNYITGTGFHILDIYENEITKENLQKGFYLAPYWADITDVKSVKKYNSLDEFLSSFKWNNPLRY